MAMNDQERAEFERLKRRQAELLEQLNELGRQLNSFEARSTQPERSCAPSLPEPHPAKAASVQKIAMEVVQKPAPAPRYRQ